MLLSLALLQLQPSADVQQTPTCQAVQENQRGSEDHHQDIPHSAYQFVL